MKKTLFIAASILLLISCNLTAPRATQAPLVQATPVSLGSSPSDSGPEGIADLQVSDGVILLTPDQPLPTPNLGAPVGEVENGVDLGEDSQATPAATLDPATVKMPDGLALYPGAVVLQVSVDDPTAMGASYVIFTSSDPADQVMTYIHEQATQAGWQAFGDPTDEAGKKTAMWGKDGVILTLEATQLDSGGTKAQLSWMKL